MYVCMFNPIMPHEIEIEIYVNSNEKGTWPIFLPNSYYDTIGYDR